MAEIQRNEQTQTQVAEISPQYTESMSGSANTSDVDLSFSPTKSILITNTHASNKLYIKFRSGKNSWGSKYKTIDENASLSVDIRATSLRLKGSGANTTYEILTTKE